MTDRPILFSAPMIQAILREIAAPGTGKTQTRRLLKRPSDHFHASYTQAEISGLPGHVRWWNGSTEHAGRSVRLPYSPGDRLWVRERHHRTTDGDNHLVGYDFADGPCDHMSRPIPGGGTVRGFRHSLGGWGGRCSRNFPGIHMPRWASRLTLHVTDVRVQRLQDISEDDARAEGIEAREIRPVYDIGQPPETWWFGTENGRATAKSAFRDLWDSLNAERAPWTSNPWVVAVTFRPVLANIDSKEAADG